MQNLDTVLAGLRAAGEHTRLRILALCARGELSVSELTQVLGQSQPRVSRHLKLLVEAGLLERLPEGAQVYFRLTDHDNTEAAKLARMVVALMPSADAGLNRDFARLDQVRATRAAKAQEYFQNAAGGWDAKQMYLPREKIEARLVELVGDEPTYELLDIGTGTGRILELLSTRVHRGVGIDLSTGMLNVARSNIERSGFVNIHVRQGDMYRLPIEDATIDLAVLHMVLHYSDDPEAVLREARRVLRPGGRLLIVDLAAHTVESLRTEHNHHRLGFSDPEIERYCSAAGLSEMARVEQLPGDPISVRFWHARARESVTALRSRAKR
jgi:ubiquinone/menaquinone biosynthesis C-methylase UbiE